MSRDRRIPLVALVGNPNSGKTSVFNRLTGLRQKVANFPGVTVERKYGTLTSGKNTMEIVDLPGTYSLYPTSEDERIVIEQLLGSPEHSAPDAVIYVADTTQFEKHLLLFTQILDLGIPALLVCNMQDEAEKRTISVDLPALEKSFGVPVVSVSARTGTGFPLLVKRIDELLAQQSGSRHDIFTIDKRLQTITEQVRQITDAKTDYEALLICHHLSWLKKIGQPEKTKIDSLLKETDFISLKEEVYEITDRFRFIEPLVRQVIRMKGDDDNRWSTRLDRIFTHKIAGPAIFIMVLLLIFQAIFSWAGYPMDLIDEGFATLGAWVHQQWPDHWFADLIADGLLAGLGGILVFVPQIAILFFLISTLEETGYMARAVYLFDGLMQRFGLNGRSVVALVSGGACAIPAIMSARTIPNAKERLITILVTPFISCSARIPIYTILVAFLVPATTVLGIFNLQGLVFAGLYIAGTVTALIAAWILSTIMGKQGSSFLMMELPEYRMPVWRNVLLTSYEKVRAFVVEAGKIILGISLVLWVLASYGPADAMAKAEIQARQEALELEMDEPETENLVASRQLEHSFAGYIGHGIEPVIRPLGYDWKIGIALITSFAAREVFVSTISTIYAIGSDPDDRTIKARLARETDSLTGRPRFDFATTLSLLMFYLFAMQCMSTLAIVKRETGSWKWPIAQFAGMTLLAYLAALASYQLFS